MLKYKGANEVFMVLQRGMPLYVMEEQETVGDSTYRDTVIRGGCHSVSEVKIDKLGYVVHTDGKTKDFWENTIPSKQKPLRLKTSNLCGDEAEWRM